MKASELRNFSIDELKERLSEMQEEQLRRRCNNEVSKPNDKSLLRQGRRGIARVYTVITEKQQQI